MSTDTFQKHILPLKDKLFRLALSITGNKQDAEDAVQDVLLSIWNKKENWGEIDNWEAYAVRSTRNTALDKLSLADNRLSPIPEGHDPTEAGVDIQRLLEQEEQMAFLNRAIESLPEKQQTIFRLREVEEMSYKEIAFVMNISEDQVKVNLFRTRRRLKELLEKSNR